MAANSPFSLRDQQRLDGIHPTLRNELAAIFTEMYSLGYRLFVVQGVRTAAEQAKLYAQGRTSPGKIVTNKDGVKFRSNHQPHADGFGHAVDVAFLGTHPPFDEAWPWELLGTKAEQRNLRWGGRWTHPHDAPHIEMA